MKLFLPFLFCVLFAKTSYPQCKATKDELKGSQLSAEQNIFDKEIAKQIDGVLLYLTAKYQTPLLYYYKQDWNNACYDPKDDHLYFGTRLLNKLYKTGGIPAITFVVCHEYSHFCQARFSNGNSIVNGTVRVNELQADFLATYFMEEIILSKTINYNEELEMMRLVKGVYDLGDNAFTDTAHHGTWAERALTMFLVESTELGTLKPKNLKDIFETANRYYTRNGIIACGSAFPVQGGFRVLGVGTLFNEYSGEECIIGIDFKLYVIRYKGYWGIENSTKCAPIGEIEYEGKQVIDPSDEALGFFVKMYSKVPYYPGRFFLYKRGVYDDETMKKSPPSLYWRTKTLNSQ